MGVVCAGVKGFLWNLRLAQRYFFNNSSVAVSEKISQSVPVPLSWTILLGILAARILSAASDSSVDSSSSESGISWRSGISSDSTWIVELLVISNCKKALRNQADLMVPIVRRCEWETDERGHLRITIRYSWWASNALYGCGFSRTLFHTLHALFPFARGCICYMQLLLSGTCFKPVYILKWVGYAKVDQWILYALHDPTIFCTVC